MDWASDSLRRWAGSLLPGFGEGGRAPASLRLMVRLGGWLLLIVMTFAVHGHALNEGLFLDDHWHWAEWAKQDWSWSSLTGDTTIEPARLMHLWWQDQPVRFQYFRPVAVLAAEGVYALCGPDPFWLHLLSVLLHAFNAVLLLELAYRLTMHRLWSLVAGVLFILYSHSVFGVSWLAAQNIVLQTSFLLVAVLAYVHTSGRTLPRAQAIVVVTCLVLALLTRENAVVLPIFLMALDIAFGGWAAVRSRWRFHGLCCGIVLAFVIVRFAFYGSPMPEVYVQRPHDWTYAPWAFAKVLHYVTSSIWLSPMTIGPSGRIQPFVEVPGDCILMLAIILIMGWGYYRACREVRGYWLWPLWIVLSILPVIPVMATPHSGYLPSVGFALAMVLGPASSKTWLKPATRARSFLSRIRWSVVVAVWFVIATTVYQPIYRGFWSSFRAAENYTIEQIVTAPPAADVQHVFFINLPFVNIYAPLHLAERGGPSLLKPAYHVLTFAPQVLEMTEVCELRPIDQHSFDLTIRGQAYFSGLLGRFLIEAMRNTGPFQDGDAVDTPEFRVEVAHADAAGVHSLRVTFRKPLTDPAYAFYVGTPSCPAAALRFRPSEPTEASQPPRSAPLLAEFVENQNEDLVFLRDQRDRLKENRELTARIIQTDLYLSGPPYPGPR